MKIGTIDWSHLTTRADRSEELLKPLKIAEAIWRGEEMAMIAEQLIALEDQDAAAQPGTERQWRDYRTQLRKWGEGCNGYPYPEYRPPRPS